MIAIPRVLALSLLAALLAACAGGGTKRGGTPEEQVKARAEARWTLVLAQDLPKAYAFFTAGYREANSLERYESSIRNRQINWTAARVGNVLCDTPERCIAKVSVDYTLIGGMPGAKDVSATQVIDENWLHLGGQWYLLPSRALP